MIVLVVWPLCWFKQQKKNSIIIFTDNVLYLIDLITVIKIIENNDYKQKLDK